MASFLSRYWGPLLGLGFCSLVMPIFIRIFTVGPEAWRFCGDRAPEGLPLIGEDVGVYVQSSLFPFGVECNYGRPITVTVFHDLGTPLIVAGIVAIALELVGLVLRRSLAKPTRPVRI